MGRIHSWVGSGRIKSGRSSRFINLVVGQDGSDRNVWCSANGLKYKQNMKIYRVNLPCKVTSRIWSFLYSVYLLNFLNLSKMITYQNGNKRANMNYLYFISIFIRKTSLSSASEVMAVWCYKIRLLLPAGCREAANCRHCFYSQAKNQVFRPAGATPLTDFQNF